MPERRKAISAVTEHMLGGPWVWNGLIGEIREDQAITTAEFHQGCRTTARYFDQFMERIDWNRVLLTALGRHATLKEQRTKGHDKLPDDKFYGDPCGACIQAAVLSDETITRWDEDPTCGYNPVDDYWNRPEWDGDEVPTWLEDLRADPTDTTRYLGYHKREES